MSRNSKDITRAEVREENQTDDVEYLRAFIGELRRTNKAIEAERLSDNAKSHDAIGELVQCISTHVKRDHWPRLCIQLDNNHEEES